jgi:phospholipid/cholesterol/gamma-HCH transport system substrate-binding protein
METLSKLITDEKFANSLTKTLTNLQTGSKGLSEIWKRQNIIFIERFFNKKKKRKRRLEELEAKKEKIEVESKYKLKSFKYFYYVNNSKT